MNIIECIDLCKIYKRKEPKTGLAISEKNKKVIQTVALDKINFTVKKGEFTIIMGPSGSGKSTLLNTISTIDIPTKGKVLINRTNINKLLTHEISNFRSKELGFIFQNFNVLHNLTVLENISLPLCVSGDKTSAEVNEIVTEISKKVGIEHLLSKYPSECSGGQVQRISIARALVNNPELILADEPTGNLDSQNSHEILSIIKDLNEKENKTIIMVTHDNMIASYGKRVIFLRDGKIEHELLRGNLSQSEFFYKIVEINSKESRMLFK